MGNTVSRDFAAAETTVVPYPEAARPFPSFTVILLALTILPFLVMPILAGQLPPGVEQTKQAILFLGQVHIALTVLMYFDKDFGKIVAANHFRYYYFPIGAAVLFGLLFAGIPGKYQFVFWWIYIGWQNWHFGKQNLGVHAICSAQEKSGRMTALERVVMNAANVFAVVALTKAFTSNDV